MVPQIIRHGYQKCVNNDQNFAIPNKEAETVANVVFTKWMSVRLSLMKD